MAKQQETKPQPSPELAGKFRVVGIVPGVVITASGERVDLCTLDLATAQRLVEAGNFPYLVPARNSQARADTPAA